MQATDDPLAFPSGLARWLRGHHPDASVGIPRSSGACPLAAYLSERTGQSCRVWDDCYGVGWAAISGPEIPLPGWAQSFIVQIDLGAPYAITAREASADLELAIEASEQQTGEE